jgi:hypothetical protein
MAARDDGAKGRGNGNEKDERERRFRVRWIAQSSGIVIVLRNSNLEKNYNDDVATVRASRSFSCRKIPYDRCR